MRWFNVNSIEELKSFGKFRDIKQEIKNDLGENIKVTGRSWNDLYDNINKFKKIINKIKSPEIIQTKDNNSYFTSKSNEYIFYLTELDGELRMKKLNVTKEHFINKKIAKKWRDEISKEIHPDVNNHPNAHKAMTKLNNMYSSMTRKG